MEITATILSQMVNGTIEGDPTVIIRRPGKIEEAQEGDITFLGNLKYETFVYTTQASAILVSMDFQPKKPVKPTLIRVENPYETLSFLLEKFGEVKSPKETSIHELAFIDTSAVLAENIHVGSFTHIGKQVKVGENTVIYPQVYIGDEVEIGTNTIIYPGVKIYNGCKIGNDCIIHANAVIGADGFGFVPKKDGSFKKMPQLGIVIIENDVEVGANTTIDRATMGATLIKSGVKLDNLIMVAHNVEIGNNTAMAAQSGIAGSSKLGSNCMISGQVAIGGHISVANGTKVQGQSGVAKTVKEENTALYGTPAFEYRKFLRSQAYFRKLPEMEKRMKTLEKLVKKLSEEK